VPAGDGRREGPVNVPDGTTTTTAAPPAPPAGAARLRQVGPGLLAAATGGAGDFVATMVAGARFGTMLL
jgi:hypothetical protein